MRAERRRAAEAEARAAEAEARAAEAEARAQAQKQTSNPFGRVEPPLPPIPIGRGKAPSLTAPSLTAPSPPAPTSTPDVVDTRTKEQRNADNSLSA
jgi:hypothetical protein